MLILALSVIVAIAAVTIVLHFRLTQFEKIPGPPAWPLVGSSLQFMNLSSVDIFKLLRKYSKMYGKAYKISFGYDYTLMFAKPEIAEKILNTQSYADKSSDYDKVAEWIGHGLLVSKGEKWFQRRKVLTPGFHFRILESFVRVFNEHSDVFCQKLATFQGSEVDIFPRLKLFTLDVLCETALGYRCNSQTEDPAYPRAVDEIMSILNWRFFNPFASIDVLFRFTKQYKRFHQLIRETHRFTLDIINERRREASRVGEVDEDEDLRDDGGCGTRKKKLALLDILLGATIDGKPLSDDDIREEVDTFTFAGHDTSASALTFILYNIAKHPEIQQRMYDEIVEVVGPDYTELTLHTLNELRFLDLVIKESLRMFPPVPMIARHATERTEIEGSVIPVGTIVGVDIFEMHRDSDYFEDAERFNPDRFEAVREAGKSNPFTYIPFSAGSRNCIGQKFAQYEIKTAVTKILQSFTLELPSPNFEPALKAEIVLKPAGPLPIRFIPRATTT